MALFPPCIIIPIGKAEAVKYEIKWYFVIEREEPFTKLAKRATGCVGK